MSVALVKEYLKQWSKDSAVLEFETSCATVELAANALGCEPARIAKSLALKRGNGCVLIVASGDARLKNSKFREHFGEKATMLRAEETEAQTGHAVGGVCPFAVPNPDVQVFLDVSLNRFATVFPACGSSNSVIELTLDELFTCAKAAGWVDVCSAWNGE